MVTRIEHFFYTLGRYGLLLFYAFSSLANLRFVYRNTITQMVRVGVDSLPIVALTAAFTGAVTTVQAIYQLENPLLPLSIIGSFVVPSIVLELAAVLTAFILAGRVGARIAAELGTMRVTEQIDALEAMGLNSVTFLVAPRVIAGVVMFPVLYVAACAVAIGTSVLVGELNGVPAGIFMQGARQFFDPFYVTFGMIKAVAFGFAITSVSCYMGYYTRGGAEGVGASTTQAAVMSCVFVLFADYLLAQMLL